jgi:subtilase family serine protease
LSARRPLALVALAAAIAATFVSVAALSDPGIATAAFQPVGSVPVLPRGAVVRGAVAPRTQVHLDVGLAVRAPGALDALLTSLYSPGSPQFHRFLARGAFAARFGASRTELASVERWLRTQGLRPNGVSESGLTIHVTASESSMASALHAPLAQVQLADGRVDFANRVAPVVPASVAHDVTGVVGLSDLPAVSNDLSRPAAERRPLVRAQTTGATVPKACAAAADAARSNDSFTVAGLASYYAIAPLYKLGDRGRGVHVAIAEFEPDRTQDIAAYQHCYGTSATVNYDHHVDGGAGSGAGQGEAALDIEDVIGLAPQATIDVYQGPTSSLGDDDLYAAIVAKDADTVVTTSYGLCEPLLQLDDPSLFAAESATFAQAATQGQVVFAASGDAGSTDCEGDGVAAENSALAVDDPASQPDVIGVGGTTATSHGEVVWNAQGSGSGGGVSSVECMSATQDNALVPGVISSLTTADADPTLCPVAPSYVREVPDLAAVADPATGYTIYWDGSWGAIGGTSAAAPLWAAVAALIDDSPYCHAAGSTEGVSASSLYRLAATSAFHSGLFDVTSGDNAVSGSGYSGGLYAATAGYDEATGLGTPQVTHYVGAGKSDLYHPGLASLLCNEQRTSALAPVITAVVPDHLASDRTTDVTITGSGFLPVLGAVRLAVDGRIVDATCSTSTRCTAVIAPAAPTTVPVRLNDQTYAESPLSPGDVVTFVAAPTVAGLTPSSGRTKGGTRVTIRGSGFTGTVTVRFGTRTATHVAVVSATKLVVTAPAGTGTVTVTVTASGGVSHASAADRYRY